MGRYRLTRKDLLSVQSKPIRFPCIVAKKIYRKSRLHFVHVLILYSTKTKLKVAIKPKAIVEQSDVSQTAILNLAAKLQAVTSSRRY